MMNYANMIEEKKLKVSRENMFTHTTPIPTRPSFLRSIEIEIHC